MWSDTRDVRRRAAAIAARGLGALLILAAGACTRSPDPPKRVFLITVDTLRADHLGSYGYGRETSPFLDGLAADGVLFERAIAQWPKTGTSLASLFVGRYPQRTGMTHHAAIEIPETYQTIPEMFRQAGYTTLGVVGNAVLDSDLGWSQGFDEYLQPWRLAEDLPESRWDWKELLSARSLNELWDGENPFIDDEHYTGDQKVGDWFPRRSWIGDNDEVRYYVAQYDANVLVMDTYARKFLERVEEMGLLEDSLIVFTADHGEALGQHDYMGHGKVPYNTGVHVPLFFHTPGSAGGSARIGAPVELVDVYPTLRDLIATDNAPDDLDGESLKGFLVGAEEPAPELFKQAFSGAGVGKGRWYNFRMVQDERWKLIYHPPHGKAYPGPHFELYDLQNDPGETVNLVAEETDQARRLQADLDRWMEESAEMAPSEEGADQNERMRKILKALGYVQ
jgi:arylsulfatase A-like enzyme